MNERESRLQLLLLALQGMTAALAMAGTVMAVFLLRFGISAVIGSWTEGDLLLPGLFGSAAVLVVSACCLVALFSFFRLCGRLRRASAFTAQNERALKRMAVSCGAGGAVCAVAPVIFMRLMHRVLTAHANAHYVSVSLGGTDQMILPYVYLLLLAFLLLSVGAICWAIALLMRRARALQDENDYTV